jgi:hypothetical protein
MSTITLCLLTVSNYSQNPSYLSFHKITSNLDSKNSIIQKNSHIHYRKLVNSFLIIHINIFCIPSLFSWHVLYFTSFCFKNNIFSNLLMRSTNFVSVKIFIMTVFLWQQMNLLLHFSILVMLTFLSSKWKEKDYSN